MGGMCARRGIRGGAVSKRRFLTGHRNKAPKDRCTSSVQRSFLHLGVLLGSTVRKFDERCRKITGNKIWTLVQPGEMRYTTTTRL